MNIGFDLDEVFISHPSFIPSHIIRMLYGEKTNGHLSYRIPGKIEQRVRKLSHVSFFRPTIKENVSILQNAKKNKNFHFFLISSRYGFLKEETETLVEKNGFQNLFTKMVFNFSNKQPHRFKDDILHKISIQRYVDDDLPLLIYLASRHPKVTFFWLNKKRNDKLQKNIYAITNLSSVFRNI